MQNAAYVRTWAGVRADAAADPWQMLRRVTDVTVTGDVSWMERCEADGWDEVRWRDERWRVRRWRVRGVRWYERKLG